MKPTSVTVSSVANSAAIPVDYRQSNFGIGLALIVTGTGTYKVQYTLDNIFDSTVTPNWLDHATLTGISASASGNFAFPIRACRLVGTAYTSGSGILTVVQGSK